MGTTLPRGGDGDAETLAAADLAAFGAGFDRSVVLPATEAAFLLVRAGLDDVSALRVEGIVGVLSFCSGFRVADGIGLDIITPCVAVSGVGDGDASVA